MNTYHSVSLSLPQIASERRLATSKGIKFNMTQDDITAYRMMSRIGQTFKVNRRERDAVYSFIFNFNKSWAANQLPAIDDGIDYEARCLDMTEAATL